MPTINIQADVSVDTLVQAAEQLNESELRQFASQVLALSAKRAAPYVPQAEAQLFTYINRPIPDDIQRRYDELIAQREAETLNDAEYEELLQLTKQVEAFEVARLEALSKLAARRGVTLPALMNQLGIDSPIDG